MDRMSLIELDAPLHSWLWGAGAGLTCTPPRVDHQHYYRDAAPRLLTQDEISGTLCLDYGLNQKLAITANLPEPATNLGRSVSFRGRRWLFRYAEGRYWQSLRGV
jgi:hypothetical protein